MIEALKTAIQMEEEGKKYYTESASKVDNILGKEMLLSLARDEDDHIKRIKDYYTAIDKSTPIPQNISKKDLQKSGGEVFKDLVKQFSAKDKANIDDIEVLKFALDIENKSWKFYSDEFGKETNEKLRDFYKFLMDEEKRHYELIQSTIEYLNDPNRWYLEHERPLLDGG